ncbi:MAG TPA: SAM-dependent methyltransferase [Methylophilaceae bacterium]|nr:SAM-dependent methyltransferase [Methylophilaceae bacterium]
MKPGTLYLIPVTLGGDDIETVLPANVVNIARQLDIFIVENEKSARQFLSLIKPAKPIRELTLLTLNEHTGSKELPSLLMPLLQGHDVGVISEAGCPGIADPGADLVRLAHQKGIRIAPMVGPSSILLALMASGLDGQRFAFLGYLPSEKGERVQKLRELEKRSQQLQETQIFIEAPYRNQHMLQDIVDTCHANTRLCIACNISLDNELIVSKSITGWKKAELPDLHKQPTVFLLLS